MNKFLLLFLFPALLFGQNQLDNIPLLLKEKQFVSAEKTAKNYLINKQIDNNGLKGGEIIIDDSAIHSIIRYYTREAGVRGLEREIANVCRKSIKEILMQGKDSIEVTSDNLSDFLGALAVANKTLKVIGAVGKL